VLLSVWLAFKHFNFQKPLTFLFSIVFMPTCLEIDGNGIETHPKINIAITGWEVRGWDT
jgi:hypothetical protein